MSNKRKKDKEKQSDFITKVNIGRIESAGTELRLLFTHEYFTYNGNLYLKICEVVEVDDDDEIFNCVNINRSKLDYVDPDFGVQRVPQIDISIPNA